MTGLIANGTRRLRLSGASHTELAALIRTIEHLHSVGVDLYLDQQNIDTTTPTGRLLYQIAGAFADDAESAIMRSDVAGVEVWPGFRRRHAPHNPRPIMPHIFRDAAN
jgi:hypothetical protein